MGILLNQLESNSKSGKNFTIIFLINELFRLYNRKEQLKQSRENLIEIKNKSIIEREKSIASQKKVMNEMKELVEQKDISYSSMQIEYINDSDFIKKMNSLLKKCSENELRLLQYSKQIMRIPQKLISLEDENSLTSKNITDVLSKLIEEYNSFNIIELSNYSIIEQLCDEYFDNISDSTIKEKLKMLLIKNCEFEKRIVQYVYNISNRVIKTPTYKISEKFKDDSIFYLSVNEKIYNLIFNFSKLKNINKYKKADMEYIIEVMLNLIDFLTISVNSFILGNTPKNERLNFTLKNKKELSGKITFKKYRLEFLHKKQVQFFQEQQTTFDDIMQLLELYFGCKIENLPIVKSKTYYRK